MRDSIENISQLQKQLNELQLENQILKNILDKAGLSYHKKLSAFRKGDSKLHRPDLNNHLLYHLTCTTIGNNILERRGRHEGKQKGYEALPVCTNGSTLLCII